MPLDAEISERVIMASGRIIDLQLDPLEGYVYWTTIHTVDCALLNGFYPDMIMEESNFSNRQIAGLTVNFEHMMFYWLVQDNFGIEIYQAELCKKSIMFWTQKSLNSVALVAYDLVKKRAKILLNSQSESNTSCFEERNCNCTLINLQLDGPIVVDTTNYKDTKLYFITQNQEIWSSDLNGCQCWKIMNFIGNRGFRIKSLSMDNKALFWIQPTERNTKLFKTDKLVGSILSQTELPGVVRMIAYNDNLQSYPERECLIPRPYTNKVQVVNKTDSALILNIPPVEYMAQCLHVSRPTLTYIVHYGELQDSESNVTCSHGLECAIQENQDNRVELNGLHSYTRYLIQVSVKSFYQDLSRNLGPPAVNWTCFGVPSAPEQVTVFVLSDTIVTVLWSDPLEPNGPLEELRYQVEINGNIFRPGVPVKIYSKNEQKSFQVDNLQGGKDYILRILLGMLCGVSHRTLNSLNN
ncbi:proto-oncogene tyrosine-protein kinase ROS-like [Dromiciops gliroides]|uniref:proto-oncogene tyrosine-protein kinase ROS-like n=1 Tax=Dromiciops gliroides TaxID=33562 RepID=UPI001CC4B861|nr:proto-oncogene tyrosine-protein kinase ROS-like [Dromiciops gliroides]